MRGDNLMLQKVVRPAVLFNRQKFMVSVSDPMYLALLEEVKVLGVVTIQDVVRQILADWYKRTRFEGSPK